MGSAHQLQIDGRPNQERSQDAGGDNFDGGLPGPTARVTLGFEERAQLSDISGRVAVFESKIDQHTFGTALGDVKRIMPNELLDNLVGMGLNLF